MKKLTNTLSINLAVFRAYKGITISTAAKESGISIAQWESFENADKKPTAAEMKAICGYFKTTEKELTKSVMIKQLSRDETIKRIADNVRYLRNSLGLSQREFSEVSGFPRNRIAAWEQYSPGIPDNQSLSYYTRQFGISIQDVWDLDFEKNLPDTPQKTMPFYETISDFKDRNPSGRISVLNNESGLFAIRSQDNHFSKPEIKRGDIVIVREILKSDTYLPNKTYMIVMDGNIIIAKIVGRKTGGLTAESAEIKLEIPLEKIEFSFEIKQLIQHI